jgi:5-methyltetrahydropteroyltriglutamate--homocysteine methyltransferase
MGDSASRIDQVSVECAGAKVPIECSRWWRGKDTLSGAVDVATDRVDKPGGGAATIAAAARFVPVERLYPCTNCGMAPMDRS